LHILVFLSCFDADTITWLIEHLETVQHNDQANDGGLDEEARIFMGQRMHDNPLISDFFLCIFVHYYIFISFNHLGVEYESYREEQHDTT
jgi:hypothetical protein